MKKRILSLALSLSLAVSLFVPAFAAEDATQPVTPTAPEWINEEDYIIFPGDEVYLPENWAEIESMREDARNGGYNPMALWLGNSTWREEGSPAWQYEAALLWIKCAINYGLDTEHYQWRIQKARKYFEYARDNWYSKNGGQKDDIWYQLDLLRIRAYLLYFPADYLVSLPNYEDSLREGLVALDLCWEDFFDDPLMQIEFSPSVQQKIVSRIIQRADEENKPIPFFSRDQVQIFLDGRYVHTDAPAVITNSGRTTIPIRAVAEALGAGVGWEEATRQVTLTRAGTTIVMTIDSTTALVNEEPVEMDTAPYVSPEGRTMIPVRYVAEFFGQKVDWDGDNYRVFITEDKSVAGDSNLEAWALPMGAMLARLNGGDPAHFGLYVRTATAVENCRDSLSSGWNISSREQLVNTVLSMTLSGHNATFKGMAADVKRRSAEERAAISEASGAWPEYMWTYTEQLDEKWGDRGILAWDLFRMSNLVQWGYTAGYVTYEEALALLEPAAILLFANFSSWDEAYENYLDGYNWWARNNVLDLDIWETGRGKHYMEMKSAPETGFIFDDTLFETGVIGLPEE